MLIRDILQFNKDKYFDGAVQANWFYDADKVAAIADSYVFHGPKYHGVDKTEQTSYTLYDTATYAYELYKKSQETQSNRFQMTIAGYGTGKSHLSAALAAFLSGHDDTVRQIVLKNITATDRTIGTAMADYSGKNLMIVLNGMRDFNLNTEVLSSAKKALIQHGLSVSILDELTTQYQQAIHFCSNSYQTHQASYQKHLAGTGLGSNASLSQIVSALENADKDVFRAVNEVYHEFMGTYIHAENDVSASDVLALLVKKYCVDDPIFDRVYILFDEFGRYIEFTAGNPQIAGESALQQIFEAVQNAGGKIIFDAFIQSDLTSYIRRVENSASNITRYVGRYENSDKYYLSSNFETILANLIEKKSKPDFDRIIGQNIDAVYAKFHKSVFMSLCSWAAPAINTRSVWVKQPMYFDVIAKGCYPLHPITVWFLANTSSWMQQRSTIAYAAEMFEKIEQTEINMRWLPYIYPVDIIGTNLFDEMLNSEERGVVQSHNCLSYQSIITKIGEKLSEPAIKVLRAILISNILKFHYYDKNSCLLGIRYCSGLNEDEITEAMSTLENEHCVITYDEKTHSYDLNAEAHGKQEYLWAISKKTALLRNYDVIAGMSEELISELKLNSPENTAFAQINHIASPEWQFEKRIVHVASVNEMYCRSLINTVQSAFDGEKYRGIIVYLYCGKTAARDIPIVQRLIRDLELNKYPIVFCVLNDAEEKWLYWLRRYEVYRRFTEGEKEMYAVFFAKDNKSVMRRILSDFNQMISERCVLTESGSERLKARINAHCQTRFSEIYPKAIPFSITEFEKKATPAAKKALLAICRDMFSGLMTNKQTYQGLDPTEKRRIISALHTSTPATSWQVFDGNYKLCEPKNAKVRAMYRDAVEQFSPESQQTIAKIFSRYRSAPYGLNDWSLFLFIIYVLTIEYQRINLYDGAELLSKQDFIDRYLASDKRMLDNLLKVRLVQKTQTDDEILENLLAEAEQLSYTERCADLLKVLRPISEAYEGELTGAIAAAILKLQKGEKKNRDLYARLTKTENTLESSKSKFDLLEVLDVLSHVKLPEVDTEIEEYLGFSYSPTYCARVAAILKSASDLLTSRFLSFVDSLSCTHAQSSELNKTYSKAVKMLQEIGKKEYAAILKNRITEVLTNAECEARYASVIADTRRFITTKSSAVRTMNYPETASTMEQIKAYIETFESAADMPAAVRTEMIAQLQRLSEESTGHKSEMDRLVKSVLAEIAHPSRTSVQLGEMIDKTLRLYPDEAASLKMTSAKQLIEEYHGLKSSIVLTDPNAIMRLTEEYGQKWQGTVCDRYVQELIRSVKDTIEASRRQWMQKNVSLVQQNLESLTVAQCIQWQGVTSELPYYLNDEDLVQVTTLAASVTEKIKSQRINGVIEMFSALTDEEKQECLRRLQSLN